MPHFSVYAAETPDRPAYIMANSGEVVTYAQLDRRSNQIAHLLRLSGVKRGDHIAMMMKNCVEFLQVAQAANRAGIIFTPISTHLKQDETAYIITNCKAKLFIASASLAEVAVEAAAASGGLKRCLSVGGDIAGFESLNEQLASLPETPIEDECLGAPMLYSSGTTGQPKGVYWAPHAEDIQTDHPLSGSVGAFFGFDIDTMYLSPAPLYHAAPLHYNLMVLGLGGTSVIMEHFDPEQSLALIEQYEVTHSQWVPIMFVRMLKLPEAARTRFDLSSMKCAIHAAAPCPIDVKEAMIQWWGPVIVEYYSGSEGNGFTIIDSANWLTHKGSVGQALIGEPRIMSETGEVLGPGEVGDVYFANSRPFEYFDEPEKTKDAFNAQGWSTMGDVGYLDEEGFLYLTDRKNFTIITGGVNVYPAEIEGLLITHDKVADVAVFGVPHPEFGEEIVAVVQLLNGAEATEETRMALIDWMRERLSGVKVPRKLDFMEVLPRMDNGKLYKRHLQDAYRDAV
ncbi:MAG: acyl-CoA synthetase [Halieaceae bacterium]|jgi:fatty-acyl-CoA synthase|nr:MAG: acyl-CoA synthetase [Halieaceae bacterium]